MADSPLKRDLWLQEYLDLGPERSLAKLVAESERITRELGLPRVPSPRTFLGWSEDYGWKYAAQSYDEREAHKAETQRLFERAELATAATNAAIEHTARLRSVVESALSVTIPVLDAQGRRRCIVNVDGSLTPLEANRAVTFSELTSPDILALVAIHQATMRANAELLAGAVDLYRISLARDNQHTGSDQSDRLAMIKLAIRVGEFVEKVGKQIAQRRAREAQKADAARERDGHSLPTDDPTFEEMELELVEVNEDEY